MSEKSPRSLNLWSWLVLTLVGLALVAGTIWAWPWLSVIFHDPSAFRQWILQWGVWAPFIFLLLQVLQVIVFVIPGEVTQIAAGWLFGFGWGSALSLLGILVGSAIAFGLARRLGVPFVHRIAGAEAVTKFDGLMGSPRFIGSLFLLFVIPGIPKDVLCYVAGLSRIRFFPFMLLSSVARLPGIFGSSLMGKAVQEQNWWLLIGFGAGAAVLFGIGWFFREPLFRWIERFGVQKDDAKKGSP